MQHADITEKVIGCSMKVHRTLGPGYLESVYRNALAHELQQRAIPFEREKRVRVWYDGIIVGDYSADLLVQECVLVEVKAVRCLAPGHEAQLVNYLTGIQLDVGLLINFGAESLEFRRKTRAYQPRQKNATGLTGLAGL